MHLSEIVVYGAELGLLYAFVAFGFALVFRTSRVMNLAHGSFFVAGGAGIWLLTEHFGWPWIVAVVLTVAGVAVLSVVELYVAVRPTQRVVNGWGWVLSTLGFSLVVEFVVNRLLGGQPRLVSGYLPQSYFSVFGFSVNAHLSVVALMTLVVGGWLAWLFARTRVGMAWAAISEDYDAAALRGIDPKAMTLGAFVLGSSIAGLAGALAVPVTFADAFGGFVYVLNAFIVAVLGGMDSIGGMIVAGVAVGVVQQLVVDLLGPNYQNPVVVLMLLVVLLLRPHGLRATVLREA